MYFSSKWHLIVHLKHYSFLLWFCLLLSSLTSLLLFFNRKLLLDSGNMCMQRRRRVAVWCINGFFISTVILITAQRNIFRFPLGGTDFNVPYICALAIWRLCINILNWLLLYLPLKIWNYCLCVFCVVNRLCFQRPKNIYISFNKNIKPIQEKVWERRNFKNPARFLFFLIVTITTRALMCFHGLSSHHNGVS
jgi:hypothetical protein